MRFTSESIFRLIRFNARKLQTVPENSLDFIREKHKLFKLKKITKITFIVVLSVIRVGEIFNYGKL